MLRAPGLLGLALPILLATAPLSAATPTAPIELDRNVLLVEVEIDGHGPYLAMLDTGTDPSAIDLGLARELGLKLGAGGEIDGGGTGSATAYSTTLPSVRLGAVEARDVEALAGESVGEIAGVLGRPLRAVLGKSFLAGRIVEIDFPERVIRFPDSLPGTIAPAAGRRAVLAARYGDDLEVDGVEIDGKSVRAILDTGSNGGAKLTPEAIARLGLEQQAATGKAGSATGYRGSYATHEGRLRHLDLGGLALDDVAAVFWAPGTGHDGKPWEVNLGNAILSRFDVTIDTPHGRVILERHDSGKPPAPR
jgi:predicted aspartyl protease